MSDAERTERLGQRFTRHPKHSGLVSLIRPVIVREVPGDGSGLMVKVERAVRGSTYSADGIFVGIRTRYPERFETANEEIVERAVAPHALAGDYDAFVWGSDDGVTTRSTVILPEVYIEDTWYVIPWPFTMFFGTIAGTEVIGDCGVQT